MLRLCTVPWQKLSFLSFSKLVDMEHKHFLIVCVCVTDFFLPCCLHNSWLSVTPEHEFFEKYTSICGHSMKVLCFYLIAISFPVVIYIIFEIFKVIVNCKYWVSVGILFAFQGTIHKFYLYITVEKVRLTLTWPFN